MTDSRILTSHTYVERVADEIYSQLASYSGVMNKLRQRISRRVEEIEQQNDGSGRCQDHDTV
jgi:hypothetical protein